MATKPYEKRAEPVIHDQGDHVVRRFTPDEDEKILKMKNDGESESSIAKTLQRRRSSIAGRLRTLARYQEMGVMQ